MQAECIRYLSRRDILRLDLSISAIADSIALILSDMKRDRAWRNPNSVLSPYDGTRSISFHAAAMSPGYSIHKTLGLSSGNSKRNLSHLAGLINVHDIRTGYPVAVLECEELTGLRTAALSLLTARYLAPEKPQSIGFIGAGRQAAFHLRGFLAEYDLSKALIYHPSGRTVHGFSEECGKAGLEVACHEDWRAILSESDIVVTSIPDGNGNRPFLEASLLPEVSFVTSVDAGRSWCSGELRCFDTLVVDDLGLHTAAPYVIGRDPTTDLASLVDAGQSARPKSRAGFFFAGLALADLAAVALVLEQAEARGIGTLLPR